MDDEKRQKRLENLEKARQRIMELRAEKEKLSVKTKDEKKDKPVEEVVESSKDLEKKTTDVADKVDTTPTVKEEAVEEEAVEEPVKKPVEEPKKVKKTYVKKPKVVVEKTEPIVIENKPVKLTFNRGVDGLWYM